MPRSIPSGLKATYALGTTHIVQCWRAVLQDGTVVASTTHTSDITIDDVVYKAGQSFTPSNVESTSDLSVDNLEVDGYLAAPEITADDVRSGRWDYASIVLFEVNADDPTQGTNILRSGTLGQVKAGRTIFTAELRGLTQKYSRRIVMLTTQECTADLGDDRCKVDLEPWTVTGTVASASENKIILDPARTEPANHFTGGLLTWTSGLNEGLAMEVKSYTPGRIELFEAMPYTVRPSDVDPAPGPTPPDAYSMHAGCMKRFYTDCIGKFDNGLNFRGFPHLPGVGIFGGPGTAMTPATVPSDYHQSPPPVVPGSPPPPPAGSPDIPGTDGGTFTQPPGSINLADNGGVPDGSTDNRPALNVAIAVAGAGGTVWIPPGNWAFAGGVIHLDGVTITGAGPTSVLYALDYENASIWLEGDGPGVTNLKLTGAAAPGRQSAWESTKITVMGATNFTIDNVLIEDAPAASIQTADNAGPGTITHNTIRRSLADSIHLTDGAHDITVSYNLIENSGDDGIAVVSYTYDASPCSGITAHDNKVVNNVWGRNMSVVGGSNIHYHNNWVEGNAAGLAGFYFSKETGDFVTYTVQGLVAENNTVKNCGSTTTGHAGFMVFSDGPGANDDILLKLNDINQGGLPGVNGIRVFGPQTNIQLDRNRYTGTGQSLVDDGGGTVITLNVPYDSGSVGYIPPAPPPPPPGPPAPAPAPSTGSWGTSAAGITLLSPYPDFMYLATGANNDYWVDDDPWGTAGLSRGTFAGVDGYTYETGYGRLATPGPNGEGGWRSAWKFPDTTTNQGHEVKAYPSIIYGAKPGLYSTTNKPGGMANILNIDGTISNHIGGNTPTSFLPIKASSSMRDINATWNYHHNVVPSGQGHFSFDIFWQDTAQQGNYFGTPPITHEIMIPLNYWGDYGAHGHRGQPYQNDVVLEGFLWHVYYAPFFAGGWRFIVFEPDSPTAVANPGALNLTAFFRYIISRGWWNGNEYLVSIGLGVEPVYGVGDIECTGWRVY